MGSTLDRSSLVSLVPSRLMRAPAVAITLADLQVGDNVSAQGQLTADIWAASRLRVGAKIAHP